MPPSLFAGCVLSSLFMSCAAVAAQEDDAKQAPIPFAGGQLTITQTEEYGEKTLSFDGRELAQNYVVYFDRIARVGGTDVALETADAAILHGRVEDVSRMVRLSRAAMANIRQNIGVALGLKAVFLVTTVIGVTGLWPAILADTGATVLVTANAMRLLGWGRD